VLPAGVRRTRGDRLRVGRHKPVQLRGFAAAGSCSVFRGGAAVAQGVLDRHGGTPAVDFRRPRRLLRAAVPGLLGDGVLQGPPARRASRNPQKQGAGEDSQHEVSERALVARAGGPVPGQLVRPTARVARLAGAHKPVLRPQHPSGPHRARLLLPQERQVYPAILELSEGARVVRGHTRHKEPCHT
ncbi:hypothetical protein V5799_004658, partial [Amblyomma americanum]